MYVAPTTDDVKAVIDTGLDDSILQSFLDAAERLYVSRLTDAMLTDGEHFEIVRWLAADSAWLRDPESRLSSIADDTLRETYGAPAKLDLKSSPYFLRAASYDPTGTLIAIGQSSGAAEFRIVG